jgi:serine/threonine protein kinase
MDEPLNEKIDVWSLGVNVYALLTGLRPFYDADDTETVQAKIIDGETPPIDPRYRGRSYAEGKLVEIIELCWEYDPDKRIDMFQVANFLREAVTENERRLALPV